MVSVFSFDSRKKDIEELLQILDWWCIPACSISVITSLRGSICTCVYEDQIHQSYWPWKTNVNFKTLWSVYGFVHVADCKY